MTTNTKFFTDEEVESYRENIKLEADQKSNRFLILLFVLLSIGGFYLSGVFSSSPLDVIILMGIIFFHEMGHLVAMKAVGFTDLKVFFIPFMGAVAMGKQNATSQLKKVFISFMGPMPGILLSMLLFEFAPKDNPHLVQAMYVLLILNFFNLLPVFPLDGGRIIDDLFSKNLYIRIAFSLISGVAMLIIAYFFAEWIFAFLTLLTWIGLYSTIQYDKTSRLEGLNGENISDLNSILQLPSEKLNYLLTSLRQGFSAVYDSKRRYSITYQHLRNLADYNNHIASPLSLRVLVFLLYCITLVSASVYILEILPALMI
ncbi:site-2 protease family protein [Leptospira idonii]|uniref:Peptidase M50 domain-containing protein n=1 Tax=Leptospira idonii TaxID=1193500 RepID=A0A4R9LU67_9LEPT|nr:site-2 protease family protein [Leptospira idonii]TGN17316.1 hypothetical protein EHS15_17410 [Leptospira idonii]